MMKKAFSLFVSATFILIAAFSCSTSGGGTKINIPQRDTTIRKIIKTEAEWKAQLSPEQYYVLRQKGTERAFTGIYDKNKASGTYQCAACGYTLFSSKHKFDSGTGWPSFYQPINDYCISFHDDRSLNSVRNEVCCAQCEGHLGHVFEDGPKPTGLRYCINSVSLKFVPARKN